MLTPRAQATVLLTVPFPGEGDASNPLTPMEWGRFAAWLRARALLPESLLSTSLRVVLGDFQDKTITHERVEALLARGTALGLLMDKWNRAGLWVMTRADADYPPRLKQRLGAVSPAVLFGCGQRRLLAGGGLAIVGSRKTTDEHLAYSRQLGALAAAYGQSVISGGARGVDEAAMLGALENEGTAVGVLSSDLLRTCTSARYRAHVTNGDLTFISLANPEAGFNVGNAMGRNKYIYCLADAAVVVHSGQKGGTWTGARENLQQGWVPLWVRETTEAESGNRLLLSDPNARLLPGDLTLFPFADLIAARGPTARQSEHLDAAVDGSGGQSAAVALHPPPTPPPAPDSFYGLFLRRVRVLCGAAPCRPDELQQTLGLHKTQLTAWLAQAVAEGHLIRLDRPIRYQVSRQSSLFAE